MTGAERLQARDAPRLASGQGISAGAVSDDWPHTKRLLPWCLAAFLSMLWLLPFDSIDLPIPMPLDAKFDRPFLMIIVAIWILALTRTRGPGRLRLSPIHYAFAGFILIAILSLVDNAQTAVRLSELDLGVRKLALLISYFVLFVVVASSVRPREVRPFMTFSCVLAVVMAVGVIWEYRAGFNPFYEWTKTFLPVQLPSELYTSDSIGRKSVFGPTIHPLAPAMMMACTMPYALIRMYDNPNLRRKIAWGAAAAIMIAAAVATQRKTSIVAPAVALLVVVAYRPRMLRQLVPAGLVLMVAVQMVTPGALSGVAEQLLPQRLFTVNTTLDRQSDYGAIRPDLIQHPLLGRGYETYDQKKYRILDNQYLTTAIGTGIVGILTYLSIFAAIFLIAHRVARDGATDRRGAVLAIAAATVAMVVGSALLDLFALPQLPYMICFFAGFAAILSREYASERKTAGVEPAERSAPTAQGLIPAAH